MLIVASDTTKIDGRVFILLPSDWYLSLEDGEWIYENGSAWADRWRDLTSWSATKDKWVTTGWRAVDVFD